MCFSVMFVVSFSIILSINWFKYKESGLRHAYCTPRTAIYQSASEGNPQKLPPPSTNVNYLYCDSYAGLSLQLCLYIFLIFCKNTQFSTRLQISTRKYLECACKFLIERGRNSAKLNFSPTLFFQTIMHSQPTNGARAVISSLNHCRARRRKRVLNVLRKVSTFLGKCKCGQ